MLRQESDVQTVPGVVYPRPFSTVPGAVWERFVYAATHAPQAVTLPYATTAIHMCELRVSSSVTYAPELPIVQQSHVLRTVPDALHVP